MQLLHNIRIKNVQKGIKLVDEQVNRKLDEILLILKGGDCKGQKGLCERVQDLEDGTPRLITYVSAIGIALGGFFSWFLGMHK